MNKQMNLLKDIIDILDDNVDIETINELFLYLLNNTEKGKEIMEDSNE